MQQRSSSCWQCGTLMPGSGGRCSACGAEQPEEATLSNAAQAPRPRASGEDDGRARSSIALWIAVLLALGAIGVAAALLRTHDPSSDASLGPPVSSALEGDPGKTAPTDVGTVNLRAVDPIELLGRVKTRALAWSKDAVLVSLRARPVASGRVDVQGGGSIEYWFGKPTGEGFGPGMKIAGKRLHVSLESTGTKTEETAGAPARAALEPNCPLDAAAHAAQAAGLAPPFVATYEMTERSAQKPTWQIATEGKESAQRQIDGLSCAVLVR
jgi:hypothetical protein